MSTSTETLATTTDGFVPTGAGRAADARILVVDDDVDSRRGLARLLQDEGFVVECAGDGASAFEKVARFDPDVVLTDLQMPFVDGIELCTRVRELDRELPVILMTVRDDAPSVLRGLRAGLDDYLTKPLDIDLVFWALRRAIGKRAMQVEQRRLRAQNVELYAEAQTLLKRYEEVLSVVSHDLRNPLCVIQLSAQRLVDECPEVGEQARAVGQSILRSVARSNRLVDNLLDETRLRGQGMALERREHAVEALLADIADLRPLALHRGIELAVEPVDPKRTIFCDRAKVAQCLSNLVSNAIKYSPSGTAIRVCAEDREGYTCFVVADRGIGIAADALPHVFDRFWQAPVRAPSGIGLGLYIAKEIVAAHGGQIWVESAERSGSTFFVSLPSAA
ncbi:response regulator [soil metagenome]